MHDRKHLCHFGKARGRIKLSMIVTYLQCLTLRVRSCHLSNALTRERSLTEKLVSPRSLPVTVRCWQFHILQKYPPVTPLWANSTTVRRPLDKMKPKDWFRQFFPFYFILLFSFLFSFFGLKLRGIRHLATWLQNTLQWPHIGPTVQPLGDPWAKWSQTTGLDHFFLFFLFSDSSCEEQDIWLHGYKNTLQWPHFGPAVQPLGDPWTKWSQNTGLDNFPFYFIFGLKLRGTRHLVIMVIKKPSSGPTLNQQYND